VASFGIRSPPANPPLAIRQEGLKNIFKRRYNVAASRARDQMWVVHSLNHQTDLNPGDYRRRSSEHALDPEAWERELEQKLSQIDLRSQESEGRVLRALMQANFRVLPQYKVGGTALTSLRRAAGSGWLSSVMGSVVRDQTNQKKYGAPSSFGEIRLAIRAYAWKCVLPRCRSGHASRV